MTSHAKPTDSMKSTWRRQDRSQWTIYHRILDAAGVHHVDLDRPVPVYSKKDKIPYVPDWYLHRFILTYSIIPLALHEILARLTGSNFGPVVAYIFYYIAMRTFTARELRTMRELGHTYGFLDGDQHERDGVPDVGVKKALTSVMLAGTVRPFLLVFLTYHTGQTPAAMNWKWLPLEASLYGIILDFWFYWYHRIMHEVKGLWKFHRTHHLTKHPNPLLTIYADSEQEFFDIAGIPLLTFFSMRLMGLPMGFYEWFICQNYVVFAEIAGHSGLRLHATVPNPVMWLLRRFDAELVVEDHDLHHRMGWRKSHNYGKQTRLWDKVFGTSGVRIESAADNVDYNTPVIIPLF